MSTETQSTETGVVEVTSQDLATVIAALEQTKLVSLVAVGTNLGDTKAFKLMQAEKSIKERADKYTERISKNLVTDILDPIARKIEDIEDAIFDLENICLQTNLNKGQKSIDQKEVQDRFAKILDLNYKKDLLQAEYNSKARAFNRLFGSAE